MTPRDTPQLDDVLRLVREERRYRRQDAEITEHFRRFQRAFQNSIDVYGEVFVDLTSGEVIDPTRIVRFECPANPEIKT